MFGPCPTVANAILCRMQMSCRDVDGDDKGYERAEHSKVKLSCCSFILAIENDAGPDMRYPAHLPPFRVCAGNEQICNYSGAHCSLLAACCFQHFKSLY